LTKIFPYLQKQLKTGKAAITLLHNKARSKISKTTLILLISFVLFAWGFSYNISKRVGLDEITAQILGILFGILLVVMLEGVTRIRLRAS
jgi:hypothetical protein